MHQWIRNTNKCPLCRDKVRINFEYFNTVFYLIGRLLRSPLTRSTTYKENEYEEFTGLEFFIKNI